MSVRILATSSIEGSPTVARVAAAATNNATLVKGSPGNLFGWYLQNNTASIKVVKFYDSATLPVPGTTAVKFTVIIPANGAVPVTVDAGVPFVNGIGYAIVTTVPDGTNTATAADDVHGFVLFK